MLTLNHGIPQSEFFLIATPDSGRPIYEYVSIEKDAALKQITLKDPKTGEENVAEIHDMWRFKVDKDGHAINAWSKLAYGISGPKLVNKLKSTFPGFSKNLIIDFLLLKKL